ncbi:MAG: hypothetical protein V2I76_00910 [Roseobacter sp.]|jgi:LPS sulfotransferase NodH|nr:hypothetical protein [Roseobacter sp.]
MNTEPIVTRIHKMPPVDTTFVAGRWHADRVHYKGYYREMKARIKGLRVPNNDNRRFLVLSRARSGTTLLTRLLNSQGNIMCDAEILKFSMLSPYGYYNQLARKSSAPVYGAKVLSYQMVQVHRMRDPNGFLKRLADAGVILIHLERSTFFQALSLTWAQQSKKFHSFTGAKAPKDPVDIDPQNFLERIIWSEALLEYERAALAGLDHMHISYDRDLADPESQMATLDRICTRLGLEAEPVDAPVKKILPSDPRRILKNYDALCATLETAGYGHLLPELQAEKA